MMNPSLFGYALLAQLSRWERLGDGLRGSRSRTDWTDFVPYLILLAFIGIVVALIMRYTKRNDTSQPCDDPQKLFRELCKVHELDGASQRLLRQIADARELQHPAQVFVRPSAFNVDHLPATLQSQSDRVGQLRTQLFG